MRTIVRCLIAVATATLLCQAALAQSTFATITGVVTDPGGALLPNAKVEGTNTAKNFHYTTTTNSDGVYTLVDLEEGPYTVRVTAPGFEEFVVEGLELRGRDIRRVDAKMQVKAVHTTVEVTTGTTLINTETAQVSDDKDTALLRLMPATYVRVWDYLQLDPMVYKPLGAFTTVRFAGSMHNEGDYSMDGVTMQDGTGNPLLTRTMDNVEEGMQDMRVDEAGNSAEFEGLGQLSVNSKSGTNTLHGSAYDVYSTPGLQAIDQFTGVPSGESRVKHKVGLSLGGPVFIPKIYNGHNKTFFFVAEEWKTAPLAAQGEEPTVAPAAWRQGNFSGLSVITDPSANGAPFPGNQIPTSRLNPVALALQNYYPTPNVGNTSVLATRNYQGIVEASPGNLPTGTSRIDRRLSDKSFIFGRLTYIHWVAQSPTVPAELPSLPRALTNTPADTATVAYTYTLRPTLVNEFRWGVGYSLAQSINGAGLNGLSVVNKLGLTGLAPDLPNIGGLPNVSFTQSGITALSVPTDATLNPREFNDHFQDYVSWFHGRHSIKVGVQLSRYHYENQTQGTIFGSSSFSGRFTGLDYADFLLGIPSTMSIAYPGLVQDEVRWQQGYFFTDQFKLTPKVTITYGLRYDYAPPWTSQNGLLSLFDPAIGKIVVPNGSLSKVSSLMPTSYVPVVEASQVPGYNSKTLINADTDNFAPRLGVAWRPFDNNNTVFRGGAGIFYDLAPQAAVEAGVPYNLAQPGYTNTFTNPVIWPQMYPTTPVGGPATITLPSGANPNLKIPYSIQYTATIEHQFWNTAFQLSYVGEETHQGDYTYNYNSALVGLGPFISKPRPFPQYPNINYMTNGANQSFNSLTFNVIRRTTQKGLTFQAYYTLSRNIGDFATPEDAYDLTRERGVVPDNPQDRIVALWVYELPFGRNKPVASGASPLLNHFIGGWRLSGGYQFRTGFYLTPEWTGPDPTGTAYTNSTTAPIVTIRPNQLYNPNISNPNPNHWFDPNAFAAPTAGFFGSAANGVIIGPSSSVVHGQISKYIINTERARLRVEINATNLLNHPNYWNPATNISTLTTVARVADLNSFNTTLDQAGARTVNLQVRMEW